MIVVMGIVLQVMHVQLSRITLQGYVSMRSSKILTYVFYLQDQVSNLIVSVMYRTFASRRCK